MLSDLTIYTTADVGLLRMVLEGVAMFSTQTTVIWGFAILICTWHLVVMVTQTGLKVGGSAASSALGRGIMGIGVALVLAMLLTSDKSPVKVQSLTTGTLTQVDNVPTLVVVVPATVSSLFKTVGEVMRQAFQSASSDYDTVSAASNGFLNPLKTLLSLRSTIQRVGGIDVQVQLLTSACLANNPNVNLAELNAKVMNAGNSGATSAESIAITLDGSNVPTSIGALLKEASQNKNQFVPSFISGATSAIMSCQEASEFVGTNIQNALSSQEFARASKGAVNGGDSPNLNIDASFNGQVSRYAELRVSNTLSVGLAQANAELVNLLFSDLVRSELNCLSTSSDNLTLCRAQMVQTSEVERNNLQIAAQADTGLKYLGQFATYLFALVIGLSPLIVLFMMATGVGAYKSAVLGVQMLVWPLLCLNAGAEIINAITNWEFSNFMATLASSGYISQASSAELYKGLSLRIGTASSLMAGLPAIMAGIFALATNAAATHVGSSVAPKSTAAGGSAAPLASDTAPWMKTNPVMNSLQLGNNLQMVNSPGMQTITGDSSAISLARSLSTSATDSLTNQKVISDGARLVKQWSESWNSSVGGNKSQTNSDTNTSSRDVGLDKVATSIKGFDAKTTVDKSTSQNASLNAGGNLGAGFSFGSGGSGRGGPNLGVNGQVGVQGQTVAGDTVNGNVGFSSGQNLQDIASARKGLRKAKENAISSGANQSTLEQIAKQEELLNSYEKLVTETNTKTNAKTDNFIKANEAKVLAQGVSPERLGFASAQSPTFQKFLTSSDGVAFSNNPAAKPYINQAMEEMRNGVIAGHDPQNPAGNRAIAHHYAASRMLADGALDAKGQAEALLYIGDSMQALNGVTPSRNSGISATPPAAPPEVEIRKPENRTELTEEQMKQKAAAAGQMLPPKPADPAPASPKPKAPGSKPKSSVPAAKRVNSASTPRTPPAGNSAIEKAVAGSVADMQNKAKGWDDKRKEVNNLLDGASSIERVVR
jgi:conjugal transfer mating pair stabilization protein TraG